jgi:iron complex outermembrane receptor protein
MPGFLRPALLSFIIALITLRVLVAAEREAEPKPANDRSSPTVLDKFTVEAPRDDVTTWAEEKPDVFPFGREGVFGELEAEQKADPGTTALNDELAALPDQRQMEFVSISGGSTPRGFTTPRLRNGLTQLGFAEQIVGGRRDLLTGFMAVLYGRTAPGGIVNLVSKRPTPKTSWLFETQVSNRPSIYVAAERSELLITKKLNGRLMGTWNWQDGPEEFATRDEGIITGSLRYAPDKKTVVLWEVEYAATDSVPAPGLPLTREVPSGLTGAPYVPLATFNTNGPNAWADRESFSTSLWAERKLKPGWSIRGGAQWWRRTQTEFRFTTGPYVLATGLFDGVREPYFNDRDDDTVGAQVEMDMPVKGTRVDQRWLVGLEGSQAVTDRERRALPTEVRDALPTGVRTLDPAAPDYTTPAYSSSTYTRLQTLRNESADYMGVFVSDRLAWARGRYGATFGLRHDWVDSSIDDLLPSTKVPHASLATQKTTYHIGWVGQYGSKLAVFVNHSTAFQPQRRVDSRTGRIQGNESTSGIETGLRWQTADKNVYVTLAVYRLWNQNITRLNPAYGDPVLDPDQSQPQLASSGEEQFSGGESSLRWNMTRTLSADLRAAWLEAITTSSPDLPEEVGRQLPRTPKYTGSASLTWRAKSDGLGWQVNGSYAWIGAQVSVYPSKTRSLWSCGGYGVLGASTSYTWMQGKKLRHNVGLAVRNALDRDLVAAVGRIGGERSFEARYSARF